MDLLDRNLRPAADAVLNGYLSATGRVDDCDGLAALPFFMSLRAAIRAQVTVARLDQDAADPAGVAAGAGRYFDLALDLLKPSRPVVVCVGGLSGTGKSVLARALAPDFSPAPGAVVLRSDAERKRRFGVGETEKLPAEAYRPEVSVAVYGAMIEKAARIV